MGEREPGDASVDDDIAVDFDEGADTAADPMLSTMESVTRGGVHASPSSRPPVTVGQEEAEPVSVEPLVGDTEPVTGSAPPRPPPRSRKATFPGSTRMPAPGSLPPPRKRSGSYHDGSRSSGAGPSGVPGAMPASHPPSQPTDAPSAATDGVAHRANFESGPASAKPASVAPRPRSRPPRSTPPDGLSSRPQPAPRMPSIRPTPSSMTRPPLSAHSPISGNSAASSSSSSSSNRPADPSKRAASKIPPPAGSEPPTGTPPFGSPSLSGLTLPTGGVVAQSGRGDFPLDEPTADDSQAGLFGVDAPTSPGTSPGMGDIDFFGGDDNSIDLAKTQKFERRPSHHDDAEIESHDLGFEEDDDGDQRIEADTTRRRRSRKGKRRTVKIPDDNVPATPVPPAVTAAQLPAAMTADDDPFDAAATIQRQLVGPIDSAFDTGPLHQPASTHVPSSGSPSPPPAMIAPLPIPKAPPDEDEIYDAPTVMREPLGDEIRARLATLPDPTMAERGPAASSTPLASNAAGSTPAASTQPSSSFQPSAADPVVATREPDEEDPHRRESAPGIFTDDASIAVLRPIQIVSDLPAMQSERVKEDSKPPPKGADSAAASRRPLPPPRTRLPSGQMLAEIEEIIPERMSLPGTSPIAAEFTTTVPMVDASEDTVQQPVMTSAQADLAVAEARAREAEAKALALEAKAREAAAKANAARDKTAKPPKRPWYQAMFEDELIRTLDNPKKIDVERESTFIEESLRLDRGSRILDLACGTGVHAVELASRGYQVVGVDLSQTMLKLAQDYNNSRGTSVSFIHGDMRKLNLEGVFDGIYCWSASFGYFDEKQNAEVLERVARALRPGGMFALDVTNRDFVAPNSPSMAWFEKSGVVCMDETKFDFFTSRLNVKRMVLFDTGKSREIEMSMRLYTLTELGRLLQKVGFEVLEVSGHRVHRGAYFGPCSPRIIITSRRKQDA